MVVSTCWLLTDIRGWGEVGLMYVCCSCCIQNLTAQFVTMAKDESAQSERLFPIRDVTAMLQILPTILGGNSQKRSPYYGTAHDDPLPSGNGRCDNHDNHQSQTERNSLSGILTLPGLMLTRVPT